MNKDIEIMIELQRHWDAVLRGREEIDKATKAIAYWEGRLRDTEKKAGSLSAEIMKMKNSIKQKEIDLAEKDIRVKKLDERKLLVKNEKELEALEHEIGMLNSGRGALEEEIINAMDALDGRTADLGAVSAKLKEAQAQSEKDIAVLRERIGRFTASVDENRNTFEAGISRLSTTVQSKFRKLTASGNGIAVAGVEGETCGGCHFQNPAYLVIEASRGDKLVNCTHCGRFIYGDINKLR